VPSLACGQTFGQTLSQTGPNFVRRARFVWPLEPALSRRSPPAARRPPARSLVVFCVLFKLRQGAATSPPAMQQPSTTNSRPNLPQLIFSRVTNPDQRRSTPQPSSRQLTSPHTPVNPQTPPSIHRRLCTESPRSALDSPPFTFAGEDDDEYQWTEDQISTIIRVCPFPVRLLQKTWLTYSPNLFCSPWQTLQDGYVGRPSRYPQAPYLLRFVPANLIAKWARALKKTTDWPHSVRSIRKKLKEMAIIITNPAQDDPYLDEEDAAEALMDEEARERPLSPRKQLSERDKDRLKRSIFHSPHSLLPNYSLSSQVCGPFP